MEGGGPSPRWAASPLTGACLPPHVSQRLQVTRLTAGHGAVFTGLPACLPAPACPPRAQGQQEPAGCRRSGSSEIQSSWERYVGTRQRRQQRLCASFIVPKHTDSADAPTTGSTVTPLRQAADQWTSSSGVSGPWRLRGVAGPEGVGGAGCGHEGWAAARVTTHRPREITGAE